MKLDEGFAREIKKTANGDGGREAKFAFLHPAKMAAREMSTPGIARNFGSYVKTFGRVTVGVCVAATILERRNRLSHGAVAWAEEVMRLWTNRPHDPSDVAIRDNLHPTRIEEYAGSFMRLTTDET